MANDMAITFYGDLEKLDDIKALSFKSKMGLSRNQVAFFWLRLRGA